MWYYTHMYTCPRPWYAHLAGPHVARERASGKDEPHEWGLLYERQHE